MALIAENHLQFIIEVLVFMQIGVMFFYSLLPLSLSLVLSLTLILSVGFTVIFGADVIFLFLSSVKEFSVPFGPVAIFSVITLLSALPMMKKVGINVNNLKIFIFILVVLIAIFGSIVHRIFLIQWILGLIIGFFIISKSFRQQSIFTFKKVVSVLAVVVIATGLLEFLARTLQMSVISPLLRLSRLGENTLPNLVMVIKNTAIIGHVQGSSFWGSLDTGFASGYVSLPMTLINLFTLPFPLFYGVLVTKKDVIDYFLPGTFGFAFDFGYLTLILVLIWCVGVILIGFKMLATYREKRESGNRDYLGREAILIGALAAFIAQGLIGLFLQNRAINGSSLVTFMFMGTLIVSNILMLKKS